MKRLPGALGTLRQTCRELLDDLIAGVRRFRKRGRAHPAEGGGSAVFRRRSYPGSRNRRYELHLPRGYTGRTPLPLVVVLHGCRQGSSEIRHISNFDALADREGFIVLYPFITRYSGIRMKNCWGWWLAQEISPGAGEVEDVWQMIEEVAASHAVDGQRIHVTGLSSGGAMAIAAMVAHSGKFASGAVVAGVPYSETPRAVSYGPGHRAAFKPTREIVAAMNAAMGGNKRAVPVLIVHSTHDSVVDVRAAENTRDSWSECFHIDLEKRSSRRSGTTEGMAWLHTKHRIAGKRSLIETFIVDGAGHGWLGGNPGHFSYPDAPDVSRLMWQFFKRHPLERAARSADKGSELRGAA
jgi:poly(hydroxyalkanoate) depolymerase family esterase